VARIGPLPEAERDEEQVALLERLRGFRGRDLNVFTTVARHPALLRAWARFGGILMGRGRLPARDRELLILRTAHRCAVEYEWAHHREIAREVGLTEDDISAAAGRVAAGDAWDATLLGAADELCAYRELSDATWALLAARYDEPQLIELCFVVGQYALIAGVVRTLGIENDSPSDAGETG
jgi:4-carboxymuconolactone decarboxylase